MPAFKFSEKIFYKDLKPYIPGATSTGLNLFVGPMQMMSSEDTVKGNTYTFGWVLCFDELGIAYRLRYTELTKQILLKKDLQMCLAEDVATKAGESYTFTDFGSYIKNTTKVVLSDILEKTSTPKVDSDKEKTSFEVKNFVCLTPVVDPDGAKQSYIGYKARYEKDVTKITLEEKVKEGYFYEARAMTADEVETFKVWDTKLRSNS